MHSEDPVLAVGDEMKHTVREELQRSRPAKGVTGKERHRQRASQAKGVTGKGRHRQRASQAKGVTGKGGNCMLIMKKTLWKNNLDSEKHAPMICANLIIIVVTDSDKTITDFTFTQPPVYVYAVALYGCEV
jgi:hypothetical protein